MRHIPRNGKTKAIVVAAVVVLAVAGAALASIPGSNGVYTACRLNALGTIRLIDPSGPSGSFSSHCTSLETQIVWNQTGPSGPAGRSGPSPVVAPLAVGDSNCPAGGAAITDATGATAYVCSAMTQTVTSPNGEYSLDVSNSGLHMTGPNASVVIDAGGVSVDGVHVTINGGVGSNGVGSNGVGWNDGVTINGFGSNGVGSNGVTINGFGNNGTDSNGIDLNGFDSNGTGSNGVTIGAPAFGQVGCRPAARLGDSIALTDLTTGLITSGSQTVCIN